MQVTLTTRSITFVLDNVAAYAQLQDGRWEVQPLTREGVKLVSYSTDDGRVGATLSLNPATPTPVQNVQLAFGTVVAVGAVLLIASTVTNGNNCDDMVSVHVVPWQPSIHNISGPALGVASNPFVQHLRTFEPMQVSEKQVADLPRLNLLSGVSVPPGWASQLPTVEWMLGTLRACYDVGSMWSYESSPSLLWPFYGQYFSSRISVALLLLCSELSVAEKMPLARRIAQAGMDLIGAFLSGRVQEVDGGHYAGRKATIIMAAQLLGVPMDILDKHVLRGQFQEDLAYIDLGEQGIPWAPGWRYGYRGHVSMSATGWLQPLQQWSRARGSQHWYANTYMKGNTSAAVGTALAMRLLGQTERMGKAFDGFVAQWMQGPLNVGAQALRTIEVEANWGEDYSQDRAAGWAAACWRAFA